MKKCLCYDTVRGSESFAMGFKAPYMLGEGLARTLEFVHPRTDEGRLRTDERDL